MPTHGARLVVISRTTWPSPISVTSDNLTKEAGSAGALMRKSRPQLEVRNQELRPVFGHGGRPSPIYLAALAVVLSESVPSRAESVERQADAQVVDVLLGATRAAAAGDVQTRAGLDGAGQIDSV